MVDLTRLIDRLTQGRVEFVVVGASFGDMRVIDLGLLIATKSHLMRLQDKLVLPQLAAIKARRSVKSS